MFAWGVFVDFLVLELSHRRPCVSNFRMTTKCSSVSCLYRQATSGSGSCSSRTRRGDRSDPAHQDIFFYQRSSLTRIFTSEDSHGPDQVQVIALTGFNPGGGNSEGVIYSSVLKTQEYKTAIVVVSEHRPKI